MSEEQEQTDKQKSTPEAEVSEPADQDPAAWVELFGNVLFRHALLKTGRREIAEELVQDTLLAGLRARSSFRGDSSVKTWLIRILKNKIIDYYRRGERAEELQSSETDPGPDAMFNGMGLWNTWIRPWDENPETALERKQYLDSLRRCLAQLPEGPRQALLLKIVDNKKSEEICKILDVTSSNLWVIVHRARMQLRNCVEKNWYSKRR